MEIILHTTGKNLPNYEQHFKNGGLHLFDMLIEYNSKLIDFDKKIKHIDLKIAQLERYYYGIEFYNITIKQLNNYKNDLIHPQQQKQQDEPKKDESPIIDNDYFKIDEGIIYVKYDITQFIAIIKDEYLNSELENKAPSIFKKKMQSKIKVINNNGGSDYVKTNTLKAELRYLSTPNENIRKAIKQNFDMLIRTLYN